MVRVTGFLKALPGMFVPILWMIGLMALVLFILNHVPPSIQNWMAGPAVDLSPVFRRYATVEEVERKLDIKVHLPAYFPDYLSWPPTAVDASQKPVPMISIFARASNGTGGLMLEQVVSGSRSDIVPSVKEPPIIKKKTTVTINEQNAELIIGEEPDGRTHNQVRWHIEDRQFVLSGPYPEMELLRIAGSVR